jgi:glucose/arabinose dehydrogenase
VTKAPGAVRLAVAATLAALVATAVGAAAADGGRSSRGGLELHPIATLDQPTYVTQAPGDPRTLYVATQRGRVMAIRNGRQSPRPFLDITDRVRFGFNEANSVEAGLYSIAFDPAYARNGRFFVFYTGPGGHNFVDRYRRSDLRPIRAAQGSRHPVLKIPHPFTDSHNGGQLQFGPDGQLWISTGDGGCCNDLHDQARSLGSMLGKLLRVDPRRHRRGFRIPAGNPLVGKPGSNAVYAWGLRNPWRFSFDRLTGNLVIADPGDNEQAREEIDYLSPAAAAGANFGWPEYEGFRHRDPSRPGSGPPVAPIHAYSHDDGRCAITGGYVVRDPSMPQLYGRYVYADFCGGRIRSLTPPPLGDQGLAAPGRVAHDRDEGLLLAFPTSFGEGLGGEIYVASQAGPIYRLRASRR